MLIFLTIIIGLLYCRYETCLSSFLKDTPFCNKTLPLLTRINYILPELSIPEKILLLDRYSPAIDRMNISYFNYHCEALHGLAYSHCEYGEYKATNYPQGISLGRTFDMDGIKKMTQQISDEANALFNIGQFDGLSFWAPNLNVWRDPRWGRGQETPGEDPYLLVEYGKAFINGMQVGEDPKYLKTIPGLKHYTAYDLDKWDRIDRFHFNAIVSEQDLEETYQPPFKAGIKSADVAQIMCCYNSINGIPGCANREFLNDIAREEWGFDGFFVSDEGAIDDIHKTHHYSKNIEEAVSVALKAGTDLNDGVVYKEHLGAAYKKGLIEEKDIDVAVTRMLKARMRIGEFDSPLKDQYYRNIKTDVLISKDHLDHSHKLSLESIVLLKNDKNVLPLDAKKIKKLAIIGPHINSTINLLGNYAGPAPFIVTPLDGIKTYFKNTIIAAKGCNMKGYDILHFEEAIKASKEADVTVLFMGFDISVCKEGHDRTNLKWPGVQGELIKLIKDAAKGPVILVMIKGGAVDITYEKENLDAIVDAGFPGMYGGQAIAEVLFGHYNPSGRLTTTVYPNEYVHQVKMTDMKMRPYEDKPGRTYKFYTGTPIYNFGDGLSYTKFKYEWSDSDSNIIKDLSKDVHYKVKVTNVGDLAGDVSVLCFITNTFNEDAPIRELIGFKRVEDLKPNESVDLYFDFNSSSFEYVNVKGKRIVENGVYKLSINNELFKEITLEI